MEHRVEHSIDVPAPPEAVYGLIADVSRWPLLFGPAVQVNVLDRKRRDDGTIAERFRIHAMVGEVLRSWTSRRRLDLASLSIAFQQEHSVAPLNAMSGQWEFRAVAAGTRVVLTHSFTPTDDTPESVRWVKAALDANSDSELGALKRVASAAVPIGDLFVSCEDTATATPGTGVFEFIARAERWPQILPHVERADLLELGGGAQDLRLATRTPDGQVHHTRSIRLCSSPETITYKQTMPPSGLMGHSGVWTVRAGDNAVVTVVSRHDALLDPDALTSVNDAAELGRRMLAALGQASRTTLRHVINHADTAGRARP